MKRVIGNIMFTNSITLIILAIFFIILKIETFPAINIIYAFIINIIINVGIYYIQKIECRYIFMEYLLDICFIFTVLFISGLILNWYSFFPIWIIPIMVFIIYPSVLLISTAKTERDTKRINKLLQKRKEKYTKSAS
jgi:hypothetical protein